MRVIARCVIVLIAASAASAEVAGLKAPAGPGAGYNIAARAKAHATSSLPDHPPAQAIDDASETAWQPRDQDATFWIDLGARVRLSGVSHTLRGGDGGKAAAEVVVWDDGWKTHRKTVGDGEPAAVAAHLAAQYVGIRSSGGPRAAPLSLADFLVFQAGWRPQRRGKDLRLQDFCFFRDGGYTYVASMMKDHAGEGITVARSRDLGRWEPLGIAVGKRTAEDRAMLWAPHVVAHAGRFHMFYTGVTQPKPGQWNQRIMVASTADPARTDQWQRNMEAKFVVEGRIESSFRPSHPGHVWPPDGWADCRDPMVYHEKDASTWYLFYSGSDATGGIVGVATAPDVLGPWQDHGAVLGVERGVPESAYVLGDPDGGYVMVVNHSTPDRKDGGIKVARARSLLPENGQPSFANVELLQESAEPGLPGWAHEFALEPDGTVLAAYLTGYWINFQDARFVKQERGWTLAGIVEPNGPRSQPAE